MLLWRFLRNRALNPYLRLWIGDPLDTTVSYAEVDCDLVPLENLREFLKNPFLFCAFHLPFASDLVLPDGSEQFNNGLSQSWLECLLRAKTLILNYIKIRQF
jgi:hypothetical protein